MITEKLVIHNDHTSIELYLNDKGNLFINELSEDNDPFSFFLIVSFEDWQTLKKFVDKQFTSNPAS
jgi:hypothetical protein